MAPVIFKPVGNRKDQEKRDHDLHVEYKGNLDLAVHKKKTRTHVTPRIAQMVIPLFREVLKVVGPRPRAEPEVPNDDLARRLQGFLQRAQSRRRQVQFRPDQRIRRQRWLKHILIDGVKYEVGTQRLLPSHRAEDINRLATLSCFIQGKVSPQIPTPFLPQTLLPITFGKALSYISCSFSPKSG